MTKTSTILVAVSALFAASAFSDDSPTAQPVQSPKQKMQACMTKQRQANSGMSNADLKKQCAQILQSQDNHPSVPPTQTPPHP